MRAVAAPSRFRRMVDGAVFLAVAAGCACSGRHRAIIVADAGFRSFGRHGAGEGELDQPVDVVVAQVPNETR